MFDSTQMYRLISFLFIIIPVQSFSQRWINGDDLLWTRYLVSWNLSNRYTWVQELDNRMTTSLDRRVQTIYHSHLRRAFGSSHEGAIGLSLSHVQRPLANETVDIPEVRLFEEWIHRIPLHKNGLFHSRIRLDQRFFLPSEATELAIIPPFQFRFRYQAQYRLLLPKNFVWRISNEWMGHTPAAFVFDQNRLASSIEIPVSPQMAIEAGYIWLLSRGRTQVSSIDVFRLTLHHRIHKKKA